MFSAIIVAAMYGIDAPDDEYVEIAEVSMRGFNEFHVPGAYWVESLPILRHVPGWIPGVKFKKVAKYYKPYVEKMINKPFDLVKSAMVRMIFFIIPIILTSKYVGTRRYDTINRCVYVKRLGEQIWWYGRLFRARGDSEKFYRGRICCCRRHR